MASWDSFDGKNLLLQKWLAAFRTAEGVVVSGSEYEWRPIDSDNLISEKILRNYNVAYASPNTSAASWRPLDTENDLFRKVLGALPSAASGPEYDWRPIDSTLDILKKILRKTWTNSGSTDSLANVEPFDNEIWVIRKIIALL